MRQHFLNQRTRRFKGGQTCLRFLDKNNQRICAIWGLITFLCFSFRYRLTGLSKICPPAPSTTMLQIPSYIPTSFPFGFLQPSLQVGKPTKTFHPYAPMYYLKLYHMYSKLSMIFSENCLANISPRGVWNTLHHALILRGFPLLYNLHSPRGVL